jgi:hypothetical protein
VNACARNRMSEIANPAGTAENAEATECGSGLPACVHL